MNKTIPLYLHYRNKLSNSPLFRGLKNQTLDKMMESFRYETWQKNTLSAKLQLKDRFYIIIDGRVEILKVNPETGKSVVLSILGEGEAFDVISLLNTEEHKPIAVALDDIQLLSVPIEAMHTWLNNYPDFNHNFLPYLAQCMHVRESLISDLALYDTPTRLARLLLRYIETNQTNRQVQHVIPLFHDITHETIAQMIGSARQVVNKHLQFLKQEGILITNEHNWTIQRLDALKQKAHMTLDSCI